MKYKINPTRFFKFNNFIINKFNFGSKNTQTHLNKIIPVDLLSSIEHNYKLGEINFYFLDKSVVTTTTSYNSKELYEDIVKQLASNNRIIEIND
jgi:hypothetical protein